MALSVLGGLASASSAVAAGSTFTAFGLSSVFASHFLVNTALGLAMNALTPSPSAGSTNRGYQVTTTGSALDHQVVYGTMKIGGAVVYDGNSGTDNTYLHRVLAMTGHEIQSFDEIYINDARVTQLDSDGNVALVELSDGTESDRYNGALRIKTHLGTDDQEADEDLVSEVDEWTDGHRLRGIAYMYVRFAFDADVYPNGVPDVTAVVSGKKVYDPRDGTTAFSNNPALCLRDYLTNTRYGIGDDSDRIDDDMVSTAADVCEDKGYTADGAFTTGVDPYTFLGDFLTSFGGTLWYAQGKWRMKAAYWTDTVASFDENDLRSAIDVQTRHSRRDNFNIVRGTFRGEESNWQVTDYPEVTDANYVSTDNGQESTLDLDLPFTSDPTMCQQIALIALERNRQQLTVTASFGLRALQVQVGDNIQLSVSRFGWFQKEFEVVAWNFGLVDGGDLQVSMTLRETAETIFDTISNATAYERDNTTLNSPFDVPAVGLTVSAEALVSNQKVSNIAVCNVTSSRASNVDAVELEYKLSSDDAYSTMGRGVLGEFRVRDLQVADYDFRARAINTFGIRGDYTYVTDVEVNAFIGDPSDVESLTYSILGNSLLLEWSAVSDLDLSHYEIKWSVDTSGATWDNSTTVVEKVARPSTTVTIPSRPGTYLIRAYDKEDNFSVNPTTLVVEASALPSYGTTLTATESPDFNGTKSNTEVDSSQLQLSTVYSGEYEFANVIDAGSVVTAKVTGLPTFTRVTMDGADTLWDDIPGNWDSWAGNWDSWTTEDAGFGGVGVVVYVSTTEDNPSGSPTWTDYKIANGSDYTGRGFRFKAVLTTDTDNITPSVSSLLATVEY